MANPAIQAVIEQLIAWTAQYRADYEAATETKSSPKRAAWQSEVERRVDEVDDEYSTSVESAVGTILDLVQESEDAAEVLVALNAVSDLLTKVKGYLGTLFTAETTGRKSDGATTVAGMIERHDLIVSTFKGVLAMIPAGFTSYEELQTLGLGKWTEGREMKKNGKVTKSAPIFVFDSPGRFKDPTKVGTGSKGPQVRSNSIKVRLLVDLVEPEGRTIGEQCMKSGIPGFDWKVLGGLFDAAGIKYTDHANYSPTMLEHEGHQIGLKLAEG